jgi:hypothetical protein
VGHSESVVRGNPSVGFDFSHDFNSGLSDHFGVKDGFGRYLLKNWMESKAAPATLQIALSTYFIKRLRVFLGMVNVLLDICSGTGPGCLNWSACVAEGVSTLFASLRLTANKYAQKRP